jgi:hypothetical protein
VVPAIEKLGDDESFVSAGGFEGHEAFPRRGEL